MEGSEWLGSQPRHGWGTRGCGCFGKSCSAVRVSCGRTRPQHFTEAIAAQPRLGQSRLHPWDEMGECGSSRLLVLTPSPAPGLDRKLVPSLGQGLGYRKKAQTQFNTSA